MSDLALPWVASDYLDMYGYNGCNNYGILNTYNKIVVGYDGGLSKEKAQKLADIANQNKEIANFILKARVRYGTKPEILRLILNVMS